MQEVNIVVLENGLEYMEIDELVYNKTTYILLVNYNDRKDSKIRKVEVADGVEYLCAIGDKEEYNKILNLFIKKNKILF